VDCDQTIGAQTLGWEEKLELTGERIIAAPRSRVWESLNDPKVLVQCIPGCEEVVRLSDTRFEAKVLTKIGPLRARFSGRVEMSDIDAPCKCTVLFEGGAGSVGMAHGQSRVTLEETEDGTMLRYAAAASIGGKLGQIGGRLIDASVKKMADDFFRSLNDQLNPEPSATQTVPSEQVTVGMAMRPPQSAGENAAPQWAAGWSGEWQRFFWFALGVIVGGIVVHLL
jgi:carbon monoxide dehydrogenase subunit G